MHKINRLEKNMFLRNIIKSGAQMKILFMTIGQITDLNCGGLYNDVIVALKNSGHEVSVLCTNERRLHKNTNLTEENGIKILRLKVGNITQCSIIEKGISTLIIEHQFKKAIWKYFGSKAFDLLIYSTPPVTLANVIKYCKKKFGCKSYLMLKDIFPQNAVDLQMMSKTGLTGIIYKIFRAKEKKLYKYSDAIGCMSQANIDYLKAHNDNLQGKKIELFPNAVIVGQGNAPDKSDDRSILDKYGVPKDKMVFIYGGNLGKPQGLDFLEKGIKSVSGNKDVYFIIIGKGSEKKKLFAALNGVENVLTLDALPKDEYEKLCAQCDVGMIMLDKRFTIPNYPSRMLSYMQNAMPMFACTDKNTDVRQLVEEQANCGKWCYSDDVDAFKSSIEWFVNNRDRLAELGKNGYNYMVKHFNVEDNVKRLEEFISQKENN